MPALTLPRLLVRTVFSLAVASVALAASPVAADTADTAPADTPGSSIQAPVTPAEYYAGLLAAQPEDAAVVVDPAIGGLAEPAEVTEAVHAAFGPLGVPYQVVVTPFAGIGGMAVSGEMVPALHDRLGTDGIYVLLPPEGRPLEVRAYGVDVPVDAGTRAVDAGLDYDAPAADVARVLAEAMADPAVADALEAEAERAEAAPEAWADFLEDIDPTRFNGPENLGFLAGTVAGILVTAGGWAVWLALRRGRGAVAATTAAGAVALAAAAVVVPYPYVLDAPVGGHEIPDPLELVRMEEPYVVSTGRVEHIAERLAGDPLYVDPLNPQPRDGLEEVAATLSDGSVPVYAAVVNLDSDDEAEGDPDILAAALASVAGREGIYLVAGPAFDASSVQVGAAAHGVEVDSFALWSPIYDIEEPTPALAVDAAVTALREEAEMEPAQDARFTPQFADDEPILPGPRSERYWSGGLWGGLLLVGPLVAAAVIGSYYLTVLLVRNLRSGAGRTVLGPRALRRIARRETRRLRTLLSARGDRVPEAYMPQAEAALILMDRGVEGLDLLGTAVLARRVTAAAENPGADDLGPCLVNPLHPAATQRRGTRLDPSGSGALCAACAELTDDQRQTRVLRLRTRTTAHSYLKSPKDPWIQHRFGADRPRTLVDLLLKEDRVH
ncbi:hypothetical protein [Nocardiopsis sp. NRRL B-16309]|uniref:hypothetical protein n=1 Tax=Nocardiopsis sp. NRRL B-16309 TaxID=1519494 RepID=UPI0006AF7052|nr:hypothetical protein [Nocardiopsis sp. NRRL B-16309]